MHQWEKGGGGPRNILRVHPPRKKKIPSTLCLAASKKKREERAEKKKRALKRDPKEKNPGVKPSQKRNDFLYKISRERKELNRGHAEEKKKDPISP